MLWSVPVCLLVYCDKISKQTELVFAARRYASTVYAVVMCPTVARRYFTKTAKRRITQTTLYDSPGTLVF